MVILFLADDLNRRLKVLKMAYYEIVFINSPGQIYLNLQKEKQLHLQHFS